MKKIIALLMAASMLVSFAACGTTDNTNDQADETTAVEETTAAEETTVAEETAEETTAESAGSTMGQVIYEDFKTKMSSGTAYTAEALAAELIANPVIQFMGGAIAVEEGYLSGFDNYEVKGFKEGAMFGPMMGSIAFVGYVFVLEDGADMDAFVKSLTDNANPRWQICVTADETICDYVGNTVFFLMAPNQIEG